MFNINANFDSVRQVSRYMPKGVRLLIRPLRDGRYSIRLDASKSKGRTGAKDRYTITQLPKDYRIIVSKW